MRNAESIVDYAGSGSECTSGGIREHARESEIPEYILADESNDVIENEFDWTPGEGWILNDYVRAKHGVHLHAMFGGGQFDGAEFCAEFQLARFHDDVCARDTIGGDIPEGEWHGPVFIEVRELAENGERVLLGILPSMVGLKPLNECVSAGWYVENRTLSKLVGELVPSNTDRESATPSLSGVESLPLTASRHGVNEIIETSPKVVNAVADEERKVGRDFSQLRDYIVELLPSLFSFYAPSQVGVSFVDSKDLVFKVMQVVTGHAEPFHCCAQRLSHNPKLTSILG